MDGGDDENTDGTSIKPVSSLRSHFEGLKAGPAVEPSVKDHVKPHKINDRLDTPQLGGTARISLDLPRPESPWNLNRAGVSTSTPRTPQGPLSRSISPSKGSHKRPMSVQIGSSPQLTPSVTVESPRSPPKSYFFSRGISRSPERSLNNTNVSKIQSLVSQQSSRSSTRPATPISEGGDNMINQESRADHLKQEGQLGHTEIVHKPTVYPQTVKTGEKPKIPAKPAPLAAQDPRTLLPEQRRPSIERRISPFSTPPSSEESSSPDESPGRVVTRGISQTRGPKPEKSSNSTELNMGRPQVLPKADARMAGFSQLNAATEKRDARTLGFSNVESKSQNKTDTIVPARANTISTRPVARDPSFVTPKATQRHVSESVRSFPSSIHVENVQKLPLRDPRQLGFSNHEQSLSSAEESRPGLPPRRAGGDPPPRPSDDTKPGTVLQHSQLSPSMSVSRTIVPVKGLLPTTSKNVLETQNQFPPPPKRNTASEHDPPLPPERSLVGSLPPRSANSDMSTRQFPPRTVEEDSDDAERPIEEPPTARVDYPDASQANRRPPFFQSGLQDFSIKSDSRSFDVCGQYLCTTGYTTRVFDLTSGKQLMEYSHAETIKTLSVVFKPGRELNSEGSRVWIGNNIGELHEIDIATQSLVASNTSHNRREVIRILRHKKDLWTLDDEGKLFVWQADESGTPSLKYSHRAHRVPKGHTFSMVVRDRLWLAFGKEIRIYKPGNESSFTVLEGPLVQAGGGDVTSGSYTSQHGGRAYFGHTDGKVTIYSIQNYACLGSVKVSDYKINGLAVAGDYLWAAYRTGKIYVYDTSTIPWTVKKDWRAHDGQVAGLVLDPSSIWTLQRLQVTSIGHDQSVRLWDGMLEDDWLENAVHEADTDYCSFHEIKACVVTWNVGASSPVELRNDFICDAIHVEEPPELLVFGFQEVVDLEDRAVTAKSILGFGKKKDTNKTDQHVSRVYREWRDYLAKCISRYMGIDHPYSELRTSSLIGLFQCVFVRQDVRDRIHGLSAVDIKCGMKGHYGNKGALVTRFLYDDSSLCFVNCHLAAGQTHTTHRNNDVATILEAESLPSERDPDTRSSLYVGGGDGSQILDHEICIMNGDLNYRIDAIPRNTVIDMIKRNEFKRLLERDQIMVSRRRVSGFRLSPFAEAPITFAPTYKYDVGTDNYDSSEKKRAPAWCDRLLYRGPGRIKQIEYRRHEVKVSDHRPVSGTFKIRIKTIDPQKREKTKDKCHRAFSVVKHRLAAEASVEYLVDCLGLSEKEARALIAQV